MDEQLPQSAQTARQQAPQTHARGRKHMGVASSDPTYLPPVDNPHAPRPEHKTRVPARRVTYGSGGSAQNGLSSGKGPSRATPANPTLQVRADTGAGNISPRRNYISTPKKGRAIFTSRQDRQRRRIKIALTVMIIAAVALALFWFFVLR